MKRFVGLAFSLLASTSGLAQPTPAPTRTPRQIIDSFLRRDLAYFQQSYGVPEITVQDAWGQRHGLPALEYEIGGCSYQIIAAEGRVIAIGVRIEPQCDVETNPDLVGVARASEIAIRAIPHPDQWRFQPRCSTTEGICARLDEDGSVMGEPLTTYVREPFPLEGIAEISIENDYDVENGRLSQFDTSDQRPGIWMYRESYGLFR